MIAIDEADFQCISKIHQSKLTLKTGVICNDSGFL